MSRPFEHRAVRRGKRECTTIDICVNENLEKHEDIKANIINRPQKYKRPSRAQLQETN